MIHEDHRHRFLARFQLQAEFRIFNSD